jgi:hypothetical protein
MFAYETSMPTYYPFNQMSEFGYLSKGWKCWSNIQSWYLLAMIHTTICKNIPTFNYTGNICTPPLLRRMILYYIFTFKKQKLCFDSFSCARHKGYLNMIHGGITRLE